MKSTGELMKALNKSKNINKYLNDNSDSFVNYNIKEFWAQAIQKSNMSKSNIINKSDFSYCYFYDVINGRKHPKRDKVIRLIMVMGLDLDDCQQALKMHELPPLYPRVIRDSIIIYAINNKLGLYRLDEMLNKKGEEPIS